jgi:hypothetical protein
VIEEMAVGAIQEKMDEAFLRGNAESNRYRPRKHANQRFKVAEH